MMLLLPTSMCNAVAQKMQNDHRVCNREFVGETKWPLRLRLEEHKRNVKLVNTDKSRIANHAWAEDHKMSLDEAKILPVKPI